MDGNFFNASKSWYDKIEEYFLHLVLYYCFSLRHSPIGRLITFQSHTKFAEDKYSRGVIYCLETLLYQLTVFAYYCDLLVFILI